MRPSKPVKLTVVVFPKVHLCLSQLLSCRDGEMSNGLLDISLSCNQTVPVDDSKSIVTLPISELGSTFKPQLCHAIVRLDSLPPQKHPANICGTGGSEPNVTSFFTRREWDVAQVGRVSGPDLPGNIQEVMHCLFVVFVYQTHTFTS